MGLVSVKPDRPRGFLKKLPIQIKSHTNSYTIKTFKVFQLNLPFLEINFIQCFETGNEITDVLGFDFGKERRWNLSA